MTDHATPVARPIVCDMTDARDTAAERLAEYERLFGRALVGRERTAAGVRFRLRADPGVEEWVRDLAAREKACCAWLDFDITAPDFEVWWDWRAPDDEIAREFLEDLYLLPDTISAGPAAILDRFAGRGQHVMVRDNGTLRPATPAELGLS